MSLGCSSLNSRIPNYLPKYSFCCLRKSQCDEFCSLTLGYASTLPVEEE